MTSSFKSLISSPFFLLLILHSATITTTVVSQPNAPAPAPPGPTNITKILEKASQYTVLLRLFRMTQIGDQINTQLNNSDQGITVFAPTDNAFSGLKSGALNSLSDQQKVELVQFHVIPTFISTSQFQTVSNPLRTQAGESSRYKFPLNITTSGSQVNISTGVIDATVTNTIYSDGSLAVYQVDKVLLPMSLFGPPAPAPAPEDKKSKKKSDAGGDSPSSNDGSVSADASGTDGFDRKLGGAVTGGMVFMAVLWL